jgi:hypothetical protein
MDLPSSNSNSCRSSKLLRFSGSYFEDLFLRRASQSGRGRAVDGPATVYLPLGQRLLCQKWHLNQPLTQGLSRDLSTSWCPDVDVPEYRMSEFASRKLWPSWGRNQKVSTAHLEREGGENLPGSKGPGPAPRFSAGKVRQSGTWKRSQSESIGECGAISTSDGSVLAFIPFQNRRN